MTLSSWRSGCPPLSGELQAPSTAASARRPRGGDKAVREEGSLNQWVRLTGCDPPPPPLRPAPSPAFVSVSSSTRSHLPNLLSSLRSPMRHNGRWWRGRPPALVAATGRQELVVALWRPSQWGVHTPTRLEPARRRLLSLGGCCVRTSHAAQRPRLDGTRGSELSTELYVMASGQPNPLAPTCAACCNLSLSWSDRFRWRDRLLRTTRGDGEGRTSAPPPIYFVFIFFFLSFSSRGDARRLADARGCPDAAVAIARPRKHRPTG